jgi:LmbE family N-acetylglucosaminyl deacetylase
VVAISPHLDDAVLSAGGLLGLLAKPMVCTVFAGYPRPLPSLTEWDEECGFADGADVVALRREEDRRALEQLGATARWFDFLDSQYSDHRPTARDIAAEIEGLFNVIEHDTIAFPLGIDHEDHVLTHDACALLLDARPDLAANWVAWADVPYRARHPELATRRIEQLRSEGFHLQSADLTPGQQKTAAVKEYPSQIRGLGASTDDAWQPEEFYLITR